MYHPAIDNLTAARIQKIQNACLRFIYGIKKYEHISHKLFDAGWLTMQHRRILQSQCLFHQILLTKKPPYLYNKITFRTDVHNISTRFRGLISPPFHTTTLFERSFSFQIYVMHNSLPSTYKTYNQYQFKTNLRAELFRKQ